MKAFSHLFFFFSSRRRHTRCSRDWSSDVCSSDLMAQAKVAPGKGYHWGMSHPHPSLPRGTRIKAGVRAPLERLLFGPTSVTNGTENFVGALRTAMGVRVAPT